MHQIILKAKAGTIPSTRVFTKIVLVSHSYGSFISQPLTQKYPEDADVVILTGFSDTFKTAIASSKYIPTTDTSPPPSGSKPDITSPKFSPQVIPSPPTSPSPPMPI